MAVPHPERCTAHGAAGQASQAPAARLGNGGRVRLTLEILAAYAQARRELRRAPIVEAVARLRIAAPPPSPSAGPGTLQEARRLGRAVTRVLAFVPGDTRCLARSLVLTRLLARRAIPAKLVIGARSAPAFLAHAWVECAGDPVLAVGDGSFSRLVEL